MIRCLLVNPAAFCDNSTMHIPRWFIWLLLYAAATFCWIVYFEHGANAERFKSGAEQEWNRVWNAVRDWTSKLRGT